ncbi:neprilysin-4-like isoform X3 [Dermacentor albipictus]|uniref:neprilysin-4-like isoform X3 n=1 Tax=Dermacentor albipictus TaxID=60249 RepID=UPI0038FCED96
MRAEREERRRRSTSPKRFRDKGGFESNSEACTGRTRPGDEANPADMPRGPDEDVDVDKGDDSQIGQWAAMLLFSLIGVLPGVAASAIFTYLLHGSVEMLESEKASKDIFSGTVSALHATHVPAIDQTSWQKAAGLFQSCHALATSHEDQVNDLTTWMASLSLDLNNQAMAFDPIDMAIRLSLDFGQPSIFFITPHRTVFMENKRLLEMRIYSEEATRYLKRANYSENAETSEYEFMLGTYGVDASDVPQLAADILGYEMEFVAAETETKSTSNSSVIESVEALDRRTAPHVTAGQWITSISKYTSHTFGAKDYIYYMTYMPAMLLQLLQSSTVGTRGLRYLTSWNLFRNLVNFTLPARLGGSERADLICYNAVNRPMRLAMTSGYLNKVAYGKTIEEAHEMVTNIHKALKEAFESSSWITGSTREEALKKLSKMRKSVGGVAPLKSEVFADKFYKLVPDITTDRFFTAWREAMAAATRQLWTDQTHAFYEQVTANAFYYANINVMVIPRAMLHPPFFFTEGPPAINYGGAGTVVGHEIMHGYDMVGSQIDDTGKVRMWFTPEATQRYLERARCLQHSYENVQPSARQGVPNNGTFVTVGSENLADIVGAMISYAAFASLPQPQRDTILPGLGMTAEQLFFVSHCAKWCSLRQTSVAGYATSRLRCLVPLMNMAEFSAAFACPQAAPMNPPNKCPFWA